MEKIVIHTICKQPVTTMMEYPGEHYKNYKIKKKSFRNQIYNDDTKWIAYWYYSTYQQENNVEFEIIMIFIIHKDIQLKELKILIIYLLKLKIVIFLIIIKYYI